MKMVENGHIVVFACVLVTCFQGILCQFSENEVNIRLHDNATVEYLITGHPEPAENLTVKFAIEDDDVVDVEPKLVVLYENFTQGIPVRIRAIQPGKSDVTAEISPVHLNLPGGFTIVNVHKSDVIVAISNVIGWIYFIAWSFSFYPQICTNFRRQSVVGLNFDFVSLNIVGFTCYSIFNVGLYSIPLMRDQYSERYPRSVIPVVLNDVVFAVHGTILTIITGLQCLIYERRSQQISYVARGFHGSFAGMFLTSAILAAMGSLEWLEFLYICSYIKLSVTIVKYVPQAYMNYRRKSTVGWNIHNVLADLTGGIFSIVQMFLNAYNYDEWEGLVENPTKFWLGLLSAFFDVIFIIQHYVLYREDYNGYTTQETENMLDEEKSIMGKGT